MRRSPTTVLGAMCSLALGLTLGGTSAAAAPGTGFANTPAAPAFAGWHLRKTETNLCLVAQAGSGERPVLQTTCANFADQGWFIEQQGSYVRIRSSFLPGNPCLTVRNSGVGAVAAACTGLADQDWEEHVFVGLPFPHDKNANRYISRRFASQNACLIAQGGNQATLGQCGIFSDQFWVPA
jgi:hypothetical protein